MRQCSYSNIPRRRRIVPAFTLIELLLVMAIMGILVTAMFFASTTLINRAKTRKTQFALKIVNDALEEFRREQPSIITAGKGRYVRRYGKYPPDELEPFTGAGIPGCTPSPPCGSLIPGGAAVIPSPSSGEYPAMLFYTAAQPEYEHRDIAAMILGIQVFGDKSNAILADIPEDHWVDGPTDVNGAPLQYLDRDSDGAWNPTKGDEQIRYIVDAWGVPLAYFAQRDFNNDPSDVESSNTADWNEGATEMIALNKGKPIIMSYGPDGREQLTEGALVPPAGTPAASLIGDFEDNHRVDDRLNQDNIYADPELKRKLATGIAEDGG